MTTGRSADPLSRWTEIRKEPAERVGRLRANLRFHLVGPEGACRNSGSRFVLAADDQRRHWSSWSMQPEVNGDSPMLDILTVFLALIGVAALGVLLVAALKPNTFSIERSMAIAAPADKLFGLISNPQAMNSWNPFVKADPAIAMTYSGPASGTGAACAWDSTGRAGKGRMEVKNATPSASVEYSLIMQQPFACNNHVRFALQPMGDATTVTWAMTGPWPYLHRIMGTIFDTDRMVGGEFEKGLRDLKSIAERG
jgi:uncharacterized protein YndB with AHSA1/START domain